MTDDEPADPILAAASPAVAEPSEAKLPAAVIPLFERKRSQCLVDMIGELCRQRVVGRVLVDERFVRRRVDTPALVIR